MKHKTGRPKTTIDSQADEVLASKKEMKYPEGMNSRTFTESWGQCKKGCGGEGERMNIHGEDGLVAMNLSSHCACEDFLVEPAASIVGPIGRH